MKVKLTEDEKTEMKVGILQFSLRLAFAQGV